MSFAGLVHNPNTKDRTPHQIQIWQLFYEHVLPEWVKFVEKFVDAIIDKDDNTKVNDFIAEHGTVIALIKKSLKNGTKLTSIQSPTFNLNLSHFGKYNSKEDDTESYDYIIDKQEIEVDEHIQENGKEETAAASVKNSTVPLKTIYLNACFRMWIASLQALDDLGLRLYYSKTSGFHYKARMDISPTIGKLRKTLIGCTIIAGPELTDLEITNGTTSSQTYPGNDDIHTYLGLLYGPIALVNHSCTKSKLVFEAIDLWPGKLKDVNGYLSFRDFNIFSSHLSDTNTKPMDKLTLEEQAQILKDQMSPELYGKWFKKLSDDERGTISRSLWPSASEISQKDEKVEVIDEKIDEYDINDPDFINDDNETDIDKDDKIVELENSPYLMSVDSIDTVKEGKDIDLKKKIEYKKGEEIFVNYDNLETCLACKEGNKSNCLILRKESSLEKKYFIPQTMLEIIDWSGEEDPLQRIGDVEKIETDNGSFKANEVKTESLSSFVKNEDSFQTVFTRSKSHVYERTIDRGYVNVHVIAKKPEFKAERLEDGRIKFYGNKDVVALEHPRFWSDDWYDNTQPSPILYTNVYRYFRASGIKEYTFKNLKTLQGEKIGKDHILYVDMDPKIERSLAQPEEPYDEELETLYGEMNQGLKMVKEVEIDDKKYKSRCHCVHVRIPVVKGKSLENWVKKAFAFMFSSWKLGISQVCFYIPNDERKMYFWEMIRNWILKCNDANPPKKFDTVSDAWKHAETNGVLSKLEEHSQMELNRAKEKKKKGTKKEKKSETSKEADSNQKNKPVKVFGIFEKGFRPSEEFKDSKNDDVKISKRIKEAFKNLGLWNDDNENKDVFHYNILRGTTDDENDKIIPPHILKIVTASDERYSSKTFDLTNLEFGFFFDGDDAFHLESSVNSPILIGCDVTEKYVVASLDDEKENFNFWIFNEINHSVQGPFEIIDLIEDLKDEEDSKKEEEDKGRMKLNVKKGSVSQKEKEQEQQPAKVDPPPKQKRRIQPINVSNGIKEQIKRLGREFKEFDPFKYTDPNRSPAIEMSIPIFMHDILVSLKHNQMDDKSAYESKTYGLHNIKFGEWVLKNQDSYKAYNFEGLEDCMIIATVNTLETGKKGLLMASLKDENQEFKIWILMADKSKAIQIATILEFLKSLEIQEK